MNNLTNIHPYPANHKKFLSSNVLSFKGQSLKNIVKITEPTTDSFTKNSEILSDTASKKRFWNSLVQLDRELDSNGRKALRRILKEEPGLSLGTIMKLIPLYARNLDCEITESMKKRYLKMFVI